MTNVFRFIRSEKANFPVAWMCHKLGVARATYYRWAQPEKVTPTQQRHATLTAHVQRVYGSSQMSGWLLERVGGRLRVEVFR